METISLPVFSPADSVDSALAALREHRRAAIVLIEDDASSYLIFGGQLAVAHHDGIRALAQVEEREALPVRAVAEQQRPAFAGVDDAFDGDFSVSAARGGMAPLGDLDQNTRYMLLHSTGTVAQLGTHEWSYDDVALPGIYVCDRNYKHAYPTPRASDGEPCRKCKFAPDGTRGTVRLT